MAPYQERPQGYPLEFRVRFDPATDRGKFFPLLTEVSCGEEKNTRETVAAMEQRGSLAKAAALPAVYRATSDFYAHFFDDAADGEDARSRCLIRRFGGRRSRSSRARCGLPVRRGWWRAGIRRLIRRGRGSGGTSGAIRLWSMYAIDSYGDRELGREALEFLAKRQRADGKMMHEFSLTAGGFTGAMQWSNFGYEYAAADATPLFVMAVEDYVRTTGDMAFLKEHWEAVKLAYAFERAHDSDGDGVYDNSEGTGWVEQWASGPPHQELYLASLDESCGACDGGPCPDGWRMGRWARRRPMMRTTSRVW